VNILNAHDVNRLLDYSGLIEALRAAHRVGSMPRSEAMVMGESPDEANKFVSLVAWAPKDVIAVKLVGVFPGNLSLAVPEPSVQGLVLLFSGATGRPLFACDGATLTFRKTAADSALGADCLARRDAEVLLVVGAGGLAPHVVMAHRSVRPGLRRVLIWNRTPARAETLAATLTEPGLEVRAVADLDQAVAQADIISCVTMATQPLVRGARLRPGTHVDLIGAYLPEMREADDDVMRRGRLFVDTRNGCTRSGEIAEPIARGIITTDSIEADLFDLCAGRHPGRTDPDAITVYKNVGGAHLDLFSTRHLMMRSLPSEGVSAPA
jgi:ornithine cyclodeaminase/alanine dehydrogenase-like protein (mu-crystallin family)